MKSLIVALAIGALSITIMALPQSAFAGGGFEICLNGIGCVGKEGKHRHHDEDQYRWQRYCYYHPEDWRCNPYPQPRRCYDPYNGWHPCY